ncbi:flagellar cap protein FliD N-terminal domain-containing protein [Clostridium ljungdahlii]|uniref:flagellar cap protein FliD N-terminal domain-containing protein n=1 Tax=Clostridium ljungdahlii TaxID=1538 RepID=UPI00386C2810
MSDSVSSMPTGATGAGGGSMLRITGLNTGLDVDSIVKKMLKGDQAKLDKVKQSQQLIQWRQDAYKTIISDIQDLQKSFLM